MKLKLTAAELFGGGGGLSLGLKQAGFQVYAAVDTDPDACATYKANHPDVHVFRQDIRTIKGADILAHCPGGSIDLLAGCPPCQGFSSLTSKLKRSDPRNLLVLEMARIIEETMPSCVMLENVPGLALGGKPLFEEFLRRLRNAGFMPTWSILQVADYGVPQSRRRLVLVAGHGFEVKLPTATYSNNPASNLKPWKTISSVIRGMPAPKTLLEVGGPKQASTVNWHVVRNMKPATLRRIKAAQPGKNWRKIPKRLRPACHQDKNAGFSNVYGRMRWNQVSVSITSGCTTFSMGRFGHPKEDRTISVREAAMLQTFPKNYIIDAQSMEAACTIIGNALPVVFAKRVSRECIKAIASARNQEASKTRK